ncbi:hypothetical protein B0J17DRAFT_624701 [Rhizoctonia solani]|nr:hypothetical protein B0J17DRAFT_624701 [Rhizoctonia solani]
MPDVIVSWEMSQGSPEVDCFDWTQSGPLYAFVEKLYSRPFQDTPMHMIDPQSPEPAWATKIGNDVCISEAAAPRVLAGPGQRRYTTTAINVEESASSPRVFIKDIWRDGWLLFSEASLFEQAHEGEPRPRLMLVHSYGYVPDATNPEQPVKTASRPDFDPEHVHKAMMLLLLAEIVRIDTEGKESPLSIGVHANPPPPPGRSVILLNISVITRVEKDNQPGSSCLAEPQMPQPGSNAQQPIPRPNEVSGHDQEELSRERLEERASRLEWNTETFWLPFQCSANYQAPGG